MNIEHNKQNETIVNYLQTHARNHSELPAFTFLQGGSESTYTFAQLEKNAYQLAQGLLTLGRSGDRVVVLCPPGLDYITALFGCMFAGMVAVPLYPPRLKQRTDRIQKVLSSSGAKIILTVDELLEPLTQYFNENLPEGTELSSLGQIYEQSDKNISVSLPQATDLAFIQYTSGSTGEPKGVMVSHHNVVANLQALETQTGCCTNDVFVNWLPLFHDLGLVNTVFLPIYLRAHSVLMSPVTFVQRPAAWFEAISKYRGSICGAPNFAYDLCVEKITPVQAQQYDLSSWSLAFNAAEPINPETLTRFSAAFSGAGFNENSFYPAYGMAEATVFLTGGDRHTKPAVLAFDKEHLRLGRAVEAEKQGQSLVDCGSIPPLHSFNIVDPNTCTPVPDGHIGEIWVSGPSIAQGYWGLPELNARTFFAKLPGSEKNYLRTGDLGFSHNNRLFISGRSKDVIIIRGQNYFPQDIELIAFESTEGFVPNAAAAFGIDDINDEKVIVVLEIKSSLINKLDLEQVASTVRGAVALEFELKSEVVLIPQGSLSKTSSGKVQRALVKQRFLQKDLEQLNKAQLVIDDSLDVCDESISSKLIALWNAHLKTSNINKKSDFFELGGDSLDATRLTASIEKNFGVVISLEHFFNNSMLEEQEKYIIQALENNTRLSQNTAIEPQNITTAPLSFAQQRLWFLNQIEHQRKTLNISVTLELNGELNVEKLTTAFNTLVDRHTILRTAYIWKETEVVQSVCVNMPYIFGFVDLQADPDRNSKAASISSQEAAIEFDLTSGKIFSAKLIRLGEKQHHLVFTIHHIAADAWSMDILVQELTKLYNEGANSLSELQASYLDFAKAQATQFVPESIRLARDYWVQALKDAPALLPLPYDTARPARQSFDGARYSAALPVDLINRLLALSKQQKTTLFVTLLTAFQFQLSRLSGTTDIVVGTDVANRNQHALSAIVGFFVNQLALRHCVKYDETFLQTLICNKEIVSSALDHQRMPFDMLVDELKAERNNSYPPVFQVKFLLNHSPVDAFSLDGITVSRIDQETTVSQYDLTLSIDHSQDTCYVASFHYNTALFTRETVQEFMEDYLNILATVAQSPNTELRHVPCHQVESKTYQNWMHGEISLQKLSILEAIEKQAENFPDKIAIIWEGESLTYRALNEAANRLGNFLQEIDVGCDCLVGIHIPNSINQVVALLGIAKAGATFLPLDPSYPADRIEFILGDSKLSYVITDDADHAHLANFDGGVIQLDKQHTVLEGESIVNPIRPQTCEVAYVLYTSGSSGHPKGVKVSVQSLENLCNWYIDYCEISAHSVQLQPIPLSFDASIKNIFCPLMVGGTLLLPDRGPFDPEQLCQLIEQHRATSINCVPSLMYPILNIAKRNDYVALKSLKLIAVGGEAPDLFQFRPWLQHVNCQCVLANIYGPTECTDITTAYKLVGDLELIKVMPIGKPIHNSSVYLINEYGALVPPGVTGEIYIGGKGVALGYIGHANAGKSSENFEFHPTVSSAPLYRTGDLAKWDRHGNLIYLGRMDNQIKINGVRIEATEIESKICAIQGVAKAKVLKVAEKLIAYIVADGLNPPTQEQLKARLSAQLPLHWVPKIYVFVASIPQLPNGKIDEVKLKATPLPERNESHIIEEPQNIEEQILLEIWKQVLENSAIGVTDNFFELGGDSMGAVKVVAQIQERGFSLSVAALFEHQTVRALAAQLTPSTESDLQEQVESDAFEMLSEDDLALLLE